MTMNITDLLSNPLLLAVIAMGVVTVVLLILVIVMWLKLKRFLVNVDSKSIADSLGSVTNDLGELKDFRGDLEKYLTGVEKRLRKSVRSVHTVRFNPWTGTGEGGAQSFATAFLDEDSDGVVISSLYARDHVSVFGKPLKKGVSEHELSDEERKAVEEARKGLE
jgi:hypothetical protein